MAFHPITVNKGPEADPHIYAEDDASIFQCMFGEDGILDIGSKLELSIQSNNLVRMSDGVLCVGGHIGRIKHADYVDLTIDTFEPQIVKGTPATGDAVDPTLTEGSLYEGDHLRQSAIARVRLEGLNIVGIDMLLPVIPSIPSLKALLDELNGKMPIIKTGSKVIQLENAARASLFTFSELQSLLGVSDFDSEKCSIVVTNGDYGTNPASINSADINTSTQRVGINFSGASLGGCRVNYSVIYSP